MRIRTPAGRLPLELVESDARLEVFVEGAPLDGIAPVERTRAGVYAGLRTLASKLLERDMHVEACASCLRFRFSGMSHDMSSGSQGYCTLVGFRNPKALVSITHACGEFEAAVGFPDDDEATTTARIEAENRPPRLLAFQGCIVGLAVGDALGFPCEFRTRAQILAAFGPSGVTDFVGILDAAWPKWPAILSRPHPPGTFSDDTQMSIALAEGLLDGERGNLDIVMQRVAARFVAWSHADNNNRAPGNACMTGCTNVERGMPWSVAGVADSKGCGAAMRVAPIGLLYADDHERLLEVARASALITHRHDAGIEGAAAAALLVALALSKRTPEQMYDALVKECAPRSKDFAACLERFAKHCDSPPEIALSKEGIGEGWVAEEAVLSALYCLWQRPDDFAAAVLLGANTDGDSDSIACIAGSIAGALHGVEAIPPKWRSTVEDAGELFGVAERLLEAAYEDAKAPESRGRLQSQ